MDGACAWFGRSAPCPRSSARVSYPAVMGTSALEFSGRPSRANWFAHVAASRVLGTVVSALAAHSIPVLPVKGVVTAHLLYDDIALRPIRDIDIRLRPRDFGSAVRLAR